MNCKQSILIFFSILILFFSTVFSQPVILINFGSSQTENIFGLQNWNQILLADEMNYSNSSTKGVILGSIYEEFTDFMGVNGADREFILGERIVVTWFNTSDETIFFTSRISFTDTDRPNGGSCEGS